METSQLERVASQVRRDIVRMVHAVNSGHPGGSLGCTEFFTVLYQEIMDYCTDFNMDGEKVWEKNLGTFPSQANWGTSSSPILYQDKLFMQFDNEENSQVFALNKMNGEELWRTMRDEISTWSTPFIWKNKFRIELVTGGKKKRSYDPDTGKLLWELDMQGGRDITTPIANEFSFSNSAVQVMPLFSVFHKPPEAMET